MQKIKYIAIAAVSFVMLFGIAIWHIVLPDQETSRSERRNLAQAPALTAEGILSGDYMEELETYLLDENSSIVDTASRLFVHKNTVKYRLQKAGDILGFRIGDVPQSKNLIYALSLQRILHTSETG